MTCIIGLVEGPNVWMAGDSAVSCDEPGEVSLETSSDPKIFRNGPCLIGIRGGTRPGQVVQYHLKVPRRRAGVGAYEWMATSFADALRKAAVKAGAQSPNSEDPDEIDGDYLIGYRGQLFYLHGDYSVQSPAVPFAAIGSGAFGALCAMRMSAKSRMSPKKRLDKALEAVEEFCNTVRRPFVVEKL